MLSLMLLAGTTAALAQNAAGDYTAGTTALGTVTTEQTTQAPAAAGSEAPAAKDDLQSNQVPR